MELQSVICIQVVNGGLRMHTRACLIRLDTSGCVILQIPKLAYAAVPDVCSLSNDAAWCTSG